MCVYIYMYVYTYTNVYLYMYVCMHGWQAGWLAGWMHAWMDGWMDGWMDRWIAGWMDGWMDGWMHACMHAWMDGWMDIVVQPAYVHTWTHTHVCHLLASMSRHAVPYLSIWSRKSWTPAKEDVNPKCAIRGGPLRGGSRGRTGNDRKFHVHF